MKLDRCIILNECFNYIISVTAFCITEHITFIDYIQNPIRLHFFRVHPNGIGQNFFLSNELCRGELFKSKGETSVTRTIQPFSSFPSWKNINMSKKYTFAQWADIWYEQHTEVTATTKEGYKYTLRHLKNEFGMRTRNGGK